MGRKVVPTTKPGDPITHSALVQLRGTSGSGKTTAMKAFIDGLYEFEPCEYNARKTKVVAYRGLLPVGIDDELVTAYVLGDYNLRRSAGGCDTIPSVQEVIDLVEKYGSRPFSIVVFEGLLLAHSWGALGEYCHPRWGHRYVNVFLDTPVEKCIERVTKRRRDRGQDTEGDRAEKIEKNIRDDYYRVELCQRRVLDRGGVRIDINHRYAKKLFAGICERTAREYCL